MNLRDYVAKEADMYPPSICEAIVHSVDFAFSIFGDNAYAHVVAYLQQQEDFHHARMREMASEGLDTGNAAMRWNAHSDLQVAAYRAVEIIDQWLISQKGANA